MAQYNFRIRPYHDRDITCAIYVPSKGIPEVLCIDMNTTETVPVPLVYAWKTLWQYVLSDELCEGQQIFSGRPMQFCKALISLIRTRMNSRQVSGLR